MGHVTPISAAKLIAIGLIIVGVVVLNLTDGGH
jgi:multidrug transporter EmrE-like cation transporter